MIQISPFHPEIDAIWHAVASCGARSIAIVAADTGAGTPPSPAPWPGAPGCR